MRREFRVELVQSERDTDFTVFARLIARKIVTEQSKNNHLMYSA